MASAHCATISFLLPFAKATSTRRKPLVFSHISTPSPSKFTKRKNYLRPKLLKTLKIITPLIPQESLTNPIIPTESSPHEQQPESPSDQFSGNSCPNFAEEEPKESESVWSEIQFSESSDSAGVLEGSVRNFSTRSVLKFGLYLVGAFVFQTICAVLLFGSADSDHKDGNFDGEDKTRVLEFGMNPTCKGKSNFVVNGKLGSKQVGIIDMDESELEKKIVEIREMARKARESERLGSKVDALNDGIEEEVDNRLVKLRKRLENDSGKLVVSSISDLNKDVKVEDGIDKDSLDANEAYRTLMFKKKYKFKGPSPQPANKPKGFQGLKNGATKIESSSISASEDQMNEQHGLANDKLLRNNSTSMEEDAGKKPSMEELKSSQTQWRKSVKKRGTANLGKKAGVDISESRNGVVQERSRPSVEIVELTKSSKLEAHNSQFSAKENLDTATTSNKPDVLSRCGGSRSKEIGRRAAGQTRNNKSHSQTDLWWCSLPYVLDHRVYLP
ncbi:uncharacterized protein LOC132294320 isoform X2 [Cornus florida]|uniref:uncharacterized protein LOC132294320 isoform X2 n=1 Tax=Cornus florida TaxID=4283 RepID=UPI002897AFF6|nr:uncharacterized protein LOC132294320 isoform X2 [Cornus florida]